MRQLQSGLGLPAVNLRLLFHVVLFLFVALAALASADEKVLYEKASAFGTIVVTEDDDGLRVLRFGRSGARQSVVKPGDPDPIGAMIQTIDAAAEAGSVTGSLPTPGGQQ